MDFLEESNEPSVIDRVQLASQELSTLSFECVEKVMEGEEDSIVLYGELSHLKTIIEGALESMKDSVKEEVAEYGENEFKRKGFQVKVQKGRKMMNYKNVPSHSKLSKQLKKIEDELKTYVSIAEKGQPIPEDIVLPIVTYASDSLSVKKIFD